MKCSIAAVSVFCLLLSLVPGTGQAVPARISYQGFLEDAGGPVTDSLTITFRLFDTETGATPLWEETQGVTVDQGIYTVILGTGTINSAYGTLEAAILASDGLWLEVQIDGEADPMNPRQAITSTVFALKAGDTDRLGGLTITDLNAAFINTGEVDAIHSGMIADNSVGTADLAAQSVTAAILADRAITPDKLASFCQEGEILVQAASGWVCGTPATPACHAGDYLHCYTGPAGTMGVAACTSGIRTCNEYGTAFGDCVGEVTPETEVCDDVDNDCNGIVDDNVPGSPTWFADVDGDGAGDPMASIQRCQMQDGYVANGDDCDDTSFAVNPYFGERCNGSDTNCDGQIDNECVSSMCSDADINQAMACVSECTSNVDVCVASCFATQTSATCQAASLSLTQCMMANSCPVESAPADYDLSCIRENCADQWGQVFGGLPPECQAGETPPCGSDVGACQSGIETCGADNTWSGVCEGEIPPATETCNGIDDNCDDLIDNVDINQWCLDADSDGYPSTCTDECEQPDSAWVAYTGAETDCDDNSAANHPGAEEVCDAVDNNCNEEIDEGLATQLWCIDNDGDGVGGDLCEDGCRQPDGDYVVVAGTHDCDDFDDQVFPGATEICDDIDNDCDGSIDEGLLTEWCLDSDGDGFGDDSNCEVACDPPGADWVSNQSGRDCDDADDQVYPGATEICDDVDNDCDGEIDEGLTAVWCKDLDGDGFVNKADCVTACEPPFSTYILESAEEDCDDTEPAVYPGAEEICDGLDNDCDEAVDEGIATQLWCFDNDGDGIGGDMCEETCGQPDPQYVVVTGTHDCDDSDDQIFPGAAEICDEVDNDCDALVDEGC